MLRVKDFNAVFLVIFFCNWLRRADVNLRMQWSKERFMSSHPDFKQ